MLSALLEPGEVLSHPFIIGEIALGNLRRRDAVLSNLGLLQQAAVATHAEVMEMVERHKLFGRGIGYVDAHLLAAVHLTGDALLWTLDKRLAAAAAQMRIAYQPHP